ncbi:hypothetical protein C8J57DRAFT_621595 [Mycena rebaudengoi]|nr:hypothetical protein C8J57DRAFT_621595 [Mycena rebaudengoi]
MTRFARRRGLFFGRRHGLRDTTRAFFVKGLSWPRSYRRLRVRRANGCRKPVGKYTAHLGCRIPHIIFCHYSVISFPSPHSTGPDAQYLASPFPIFSPHPIQPHSSLQRTYPECPRSHSSCNKAAANVFRRGSSSYVQNGPPSTTTVLRNSRDVGRWFRLGLALFWCVLLLFLKLLCTFISSHSPLFIIIRLLSDVRPHLHVRGCIPLSSYWPVETPLPFLAPAILSFQRVPNAS